MVSEHEIRWRSLLSTARAHLADSGHPEWKIGGGFALAMRHGHRGTFSVDVHVGSPSDWRKIIASMPGAVGAHTRYGREDGHRIRCFLPGTGEIGYLWAAPAADMDTVLMRLGCCSIPGRPPLEVPTLSDREILCQKLLYRAAAFDGRDFRDFAAVTSVRPELLDDPLLRRVGGRRRRALMHRTSLPIVRTGYEQVIPGRNSCMCPSYDRAREALLAWLEDAHRTNGRRSGTSSRRKISEEVIVHQEPARCP